MATPRIGRFGTTVYSWSDGSLFNGHALFGLIPPKDGSFFYSEVDHRADSPDTLPQFAPVPVVDGLLNANLGLYFSADTAVPGMQYNVSFYDSTGRRISAPSAAFTVSTDPITNIPTPTLTAPTTGGTPPTPD